MSLDLFGRCELDLFDPPSGCRARSPPELRKQREATEQLDIRHCEHSEAIQGLPLRGPWIASSLRSSQ
jgi:hypothetical protein